MTSYPNKFRIHRGSDAFTLIELITAISIVAILALILIPTIASVRQNAIEVEGLSNIRQIGGAISLFAVENSQKFPPAVSATTDYSAILSPFLNGEGSTWADNPERSKVFRDPFESNQSGDYHFSANPNFMPDIQQWNEDSPRPRDIDRLISVDEATRPAEQILLADGCVVNKWNNSAATLYSVSGIWQNYPTANSDTLIEKGPDSDNAGGHLRWRADGGNAIKALFADGRVAIISSDNLKQKNFQKDR